MVTFDVNKMWYSVEKRCYMILSPDDIQLLAEKVNTLHGGILKKDSVILLSSPFKCIFDLVVIKSNPCVLIKLLGSGAYGKVYQGYDLKRKKKIAIKSQPAIYADIINKQAEITKLNGIGLADISANIGPSFLADKNGYFILPLADINFRNWVVQKIVAGQYTLIIKALIKIAQDLEKLHSQGKVHMDLKDDNVLVINDEAFISDFGKTESDGKVVPSTQVQYMIYNPKIKKHVIHYPQCAPEYFFENSKNPFYTICYTFDLYSYGFLIKTVSRMMRDTKYKGELAAISTYTHRVNAKERKSLADVIIYLSKLL